MQGKEETIRNMFWDIFFIKIQDSPFQTYHPNEVMVQRNVEFYKQTKFLIFN